MTKSAMTAKTSRFLGLLALLALAGVGTSGCASVGKAMGLEKTAPDEFAVVTKAPLIIPPDFSLRPPQPGAARPNDPVPSEKASEALFQTAGHEAAPLEASDGEKALVEMAGADDTDGSIRAIVEEDYAAATAPKKTLMSRVAFWSNDEEEAAPPTVEGPADKAAEEAKERYIEREQRKTFAERVFFWRKDKDEEAEDEESSDDENSEEEASTEEADS